MIPTNKFTFGIMVLEPKEKINDIKKAKNVTVITHFVLLFLFFDILFPFWLLKKANRVGLLLNTMAILIVNFMS